MTDEAQQVEPSQFLPCAVCGNFPAHRLKASSSASFVLFWRRRYINEVLCPMCAEYAYIENQKRSGRFGWWGPVSFIYTLFSLIRNKVQISGHRKQVPLIFIDGEPHRRPIVQIRRDFPTVAVTLLVFLALVAVPTWNWYSSQYRNADGNVTEVYFASWEEVRAGDCVGFTPSQMQKESIPEPVELLPCSMPHHYQATKTDVYSPEQNIFLDSNFDKFAEKNCTSDSTLDSIDWTIVMHLPDINGYFLGPRDQTTFDESPFYACFIGDDTVTVTYSLLK